MRRSILSFATSFCLSLLCFDTSFARQEKPETLLDKFLDDIQESVAALNIWYSFYTVFPNTYPSGQLRITGADIELENEVLQLNNNTIRGFGGAIRCRNCTLDNMSSPIFFKNNYAESTTTTETNQGLGGGIYTDKHCFIINNHFPICFDRNVATRGGGALYIVNALLLENNTKPAYFIGNHRGGIEAGNVVIRDCSDILLFDNFGTAMVFSGSGICDLSADNGDIIFYMNSSMSNTREAIYRGGTGRMKLGAKKYHSIRFYDPVYFNSSNSSTYPTIFNERNEQQGTVIFSSEYLPMTEQSLLDRQSRFRRRCHLKNGMLSVIDGAILSMFKFTQENGILCLGNGGTISTEGKTANDQNSSRGGSLQITHLALDLVGLTKDNAQPARLWIKPWKGAAADATYSPDSQPTITVSGDLLFFDKEGHDPYDLIDLSEPRTQVPLLYTWDNAPTASTRGQITIDDLNLEGVNTQQHFGHQGKWTLTWVDQPGLDASATSSPSIFGLNPQRRILYGDWAPTGYIPDPKYNSPLIPNTIWESVYTLIPGMQPHSQRLGSSLSGQLLGMVHVQNTVDNRPGFHMRTKAYWAEAQRQGMNNQKMSLSFGQSFSNIKEKLTDHKLTSKNYGATFKMFSSVCCGLLDISTCLGYAFGAHNSSFLYPDNKTAQGKFESHTVGASTRVIKTFSLQESCLEVAPFAEARCLHSFLSSFVEKTIIPSDTRKFSTDRPFWDFTTPLGVSLRPLEAEPSYPHPTWSCSVAYLPTWYRKKPTIKTTKVVSKGSWIATGTRVSKHALSLSIASEMQPLPFLRTICMYEGTYSTTTVCNYMTLKAAVMF